MIGSSQRPPFTPDSSAEEIAFNKGNAAFGDARHNSIVNADGQVLGESGQILARPTAMSKFLRQWHESCWVHLKPASILLFRTRNDFEVWVKAANGDFSNRKRNRTTQLVIDFDTLGILADRRSSGNKENVAHGIEPSKLSTFSRGSSVKLLSKLQKYALGDVSSSMYGKMALYTFNLERYSHVGVDSVASFASANPHELRAFRKVIQECINVTTKPKRGEIKMARNCSDEHTHLSTVRHSQVMFSTGKSKPFVQKYARID